MQVQRIAEKYLERRFDRRIQCFGAVLFLIETTLWLPIAIYVPALTFNQVTGIDIHIITPIVSGICIFYTTVGGIKAVVFTDLVQSFIMFGSIFLVAIKGTMKVGGFDVVWQRNMDSGRLEFPELTLDPTVRMSLLCVIIGGTVIRIQGTAISQPAVQRFVSLPSVKDIKQTLILLSIGLTILLSTCVYIGLVTFATYYDCDPLTTKLAKATDQLVPLLVMEVLGEYPGLAGFFVSAVFSAALSSLSTVLNSMSAVILEDFAKPFSRHSLTERQTAILLRSVVVIFGTIAIAMVYVVEKLGTVLQLSGTLQSVTQGPLFGVFVVGFCMPWVNTKSVIAGSVVSSLIMGWICIRAQIAIFAKEFVAPQKPVSVEGCTYDYGYIPLLNSTLSDQPHQVETSQHISWLWYGVFGAVITIIASNMATVVFGRVKKEDVDPDLVAPFLQEYYRANKYDSVPMVNKIDPTDLYLKRRFDRRIQCFGAVLYLIEAAMFLPIAIYVPALTFNQVTGIDVHTITPIVSGICIFYTTVGGIKAVVFTDLVQSFIMFGSIFLVAIKGTMKVGGFDVVWQRNMDSGRIEFPELTLDPTVRMSLLCVIIGGTVMRIQGTGINQSAVQRFVSLPSIKDIKQTLILFTIGLTILLSTCVYIGLVTFATYYDCDPLTTKLAKATDQLVPLLVMEVLGEYPGLAGLFVSAVFSAALSSLSTELNSMSAVILEDFAKPFSRHSLTERQTAIILRSVVVIFGTIAIAMVYVVEKLGTVLQLAGTLQSVTQGPLFGVFVVGFCMPWVNTKSVIAGSVVSSLIMGWICIRAQIAIFAKEFVAPQKPVSVEGCTYDYGYIPLLNSTLSDQPHQVETSQHISWLWYGVFGAVITIIASNMATVVFGRVKKEDVDPDLVAPFLQEYYRANKYDSVPMVNKIDPTDLVL